MGFTIAQGLMIVFLIASTMAGSTARPCGNSNNTQTSKRIVVGDSHHWTYGFNYSKWAIKHGPFYLNDTLGELNYFAIATCYILPCIVQVVKYSDKNHIFKPLVFLWQIIKFILISKYIVNSNFENFFQFIYSKIINLDP